MVFVSRSKFQNLPERPTNMVSNCSISFDVNVNSLTERHFLECCIRE